MIVRLGILFALTLCLTVSSTMAGSFGVGIVLGEPMGLSFKQWIDDTNALDAAAAWSFGNDAAFHVHVDYLYHRPVHAESDVGGFLFYFGIGGRFKAVKDEGRIGVRAPLGLDYVFSDAPMDLFFEVAPILDLAPGTEFRVNGGMGIRYFYLSSNRASILYARSSQKRR